MAESTGIAWCDATFNPWIGCEKVSPGCAHCYAETLATGRMGRPGTWGANGVRQVTSDANWKKPLRWARLAHQGLLPDKSANRDGHRPRIFCASMADVFEERLELDEPRRRLFGLIDQTPELDWLVLTKRPEFARDWLLRYRAERWPCETCDLGYEEGECSCLEPRQQNVWMGVSIENARHTWRAEVLREIPAAVRFISAEPLLGSLFEDRAHPRATRPDDPEARTHAPLDLDGIDWIITGGESGSGARAFLLEHAREIIRAATCARCEGQGWTVEAEHDPYCDGGCEQCPVPVQRECDACELRGHTPAVFVKQLGAKPIDSTPSGFTRGFLHLRDRQGGDPDEWPADLRVQEFPRSAA